MERLLQQLRFGRSARCEDSLCRGGTAGVGQKAPTPTTDVGERRSRAQLSLRISLVRRRYASRCELFRHGTEAGHRTGCPIELGTNVSGAYVDVCGDISRGERGNRLGESCRIAGD